MNSNGYLVPKKINEIKELDTLILSIDGDQDAHNKNREEGSFEKVMKAYYCALKNRIPVHTATILTKNNLHSIDFILELAKINSTWAQFNIVVDKLFLDSPANFKVEMDAYREALKKILEFKNKGYPIYFSSKAFEYVMKWEDYTRENFIGMEPSWPYVKCSAGKYRCIIDADGNVYPCELLIGKTPVYNILKDDEKYIFTMLSRHNCRACYLVQQNEFNLIYRLEPSVILNYIKYAALSTK